CAENRRDSARAIPGKGNSNSLYPDARSFCLRVGSGQRKATSGNRVAVAVAFHFLAIATLALVAVGCERAPPQPALFELLKPEATGVTFSNNLPEKPDFNILNYLYYYNGA